MIFRKIWKDLKRHKARTILTVLGLGISLIAISGFSIINESIIESTKTAYGEGNMADAHILIYPADKWNNSYIEGIDEIKYHDVVYRTHLSGEIKKEIETIDIRGVNFTNVKNEVSILGILIDEGEFPEEGKNELIIDYSAADALGLKINDKITITFSTEIDFTIVALGRTISGATYAFGGFVTIWMSIERLRDLKNKSDYFNWVYIKTEEDADVEDAINKLSLQMVTINPGLYIVEKRIYTNEDDWRLNVLSVLESIIEVCAVVGMVMGGILAASTIHMTISQEKRDISLLKIIGGQRKHIISIYLAEALILGIISSFVGLTISIIFSYFLLNSYVHSMNLTYISYIIPFEAISFAFILPILTALIFSLPIIFSVLKIRPLEYFKKKNKSRKKSGHSSSKAMLLKYSFKNMTLQKGRFLFITVMMSFAIFAVVGCYGGIESAYVGIDDAINNMPGDIFVYSENNYSDSEVTQMIDDFVDNEDYHGEVDGYTTAIWYEFGRIWEDTDSGSSRTTIVGIKTDTDFYDNYPLIKGRRLEKKDDNKYNVLVTERFIEDIAQTSLDINDEIIIGDLSINHTFTIVGIIRDFNNFGRICYTSLPTLQTLLNMTGKVNFFYINLKNQDDDIKFAKDFSKYGPVKAGGWIITTATFWKESNKHLIEVFSLLGIVLTVLGVAVAIIGGMNCFTMSSLERQQEIGVLKIIGSNPRWIFKAFFLEAMLISAVSCVIGILAGRFYLIPLINRIVNEHFHVPLVFSIQCLLLGIIMAIVTGFLAVIFPAYKAAKTPSIEGLRYE